VFYNPYGNPENPFGSAESVYDFISCWRAPGGHLGNTRESYLTFFSPGSYPRGGDIVNFLYEYIVDPFLLFL
jgi:hypothetical protein